jgi:molybdopterin converting factor small subunit
MFGQVRCRKCRRVTYFARALGAARSGHPDLAKTEIAKLGELRDKLQGKDAYWSQQVDIQQQVASAWVIYAEGKKDEALKAMSVAADAEDKDREASGDTGRADPRARALRRHAA